MNASHRIVVIGAGAAGTLAAVHLLERARRTGTGLDVRLVDDAGTAGRGVAYATADSRHRLNVPSGRMSAYPDRPHHFADWLAARLGGAPEPDAYAPRGLYGQYLADVLAAAARTSTGRLNRLRDRAVEVTEDGSRVRVGLRSGAGLEADAVVLALGTFPPPVSWAPAELRDSFRFVRDPWAAGALSGVPDDRDVLLVGTGLTMADVALTLARPGRVVHAVSRHGLLPQAQADRLTAPVPPPPLKPQHGLAALRRSLLCHASAVRRSQGDWRPGIDGLRSITANLWRELPAQDRERFLTEDLRLWEVHRHRLAPASAAALQAAMGAGRVAVGRAVVERAAERPEGLRVALSDGRTLTVGKVVNCTGANGDYRQVADPLVRSLLVTGLARPGRHGLGLATAEDGRLTPADAARPAPLWTLGAPRRGDLWETTAVPEIRAQAALLADTLTRLPVRLPAGE